MTTPTTTPTMADYAILSVDSCKDNPLDRGVGKWTKEGFEPGDNPESGLKAQAYKNTDYPNHVVIAIAGTDGLTATKDWVANTGFVTGKMSNQFKQALEYTARLIDKANRESQGNDNPTTFSVTGHSLGGGMAQIIANTFNLNGISLDAPGAKKITDNPEYQNFVATLKNKYPDAFANVDKSGVGSNFENVVETGSMVNKVGEHLGATKNIDAIDSISDNPLFSLLAKLPHFKALYAVMVAYDIFNNHDKEALAKYLIGQEINKLLSIQNPTQEQLQQIDALQKILQQQTNSGGTFTQNDPLAFDLDGDGIEVVSNNNGVMFDHNNNAVKTKTAWLSGDDAWLVLDKNNNGVIDNGAELFGNNTTLSNGQKAKDGIKALADLDSNQDGIIDNKDTKFNDLKLWQDTNQDGISQAAELSTLSELGIQSINLTRTGASNTFDGATQNDGLEFSKTDGSTGKVAELFLHENAFYSAFDADKTFKNADFNLKGLGYVRDLAGAMSEDATLKTLVEDIISQSAYHQQSQLFDSILYQWSKGAIKTSAFNAEFIDSNIQRHNGELIRFDIKQHLKTKISCARKHEC